MIQSVAVTWTCLQREEFEEGYCILEIKNARYNAMQIDSEDEDTKEEKEEEQHFTSNNNEEDVVEYFGSSIVCPGNFIADIDTLALGV